MSYRDSRFKLTTWVVTRESAEALRGPLKFLKENHPQKRVRLQASGLLEKLRPFEGGTKQLVVSRKEKSFLLTLYEAYPEALTPPRQLVMNLDPRATSEEARRPASGGRKLPKAPKPKLKENLTPEEQEERNQTLKQAEYQPKPESYWNQQLKEMSK